MIQNDVYLTRRNGIHSLSRRVSANLRERLTQYLVIITRRTGSRDKALRSAATLSDRLERHRESLWLELFHSKELSFSLINHVPSQQVDASASLDNALQTLPRLRGDGRGKTLVQVTRGSVEYLHVHGAPQIKNFQ